MKVVMAISANISIALGLAIYLLANYTSGVHILFQIGWVILMLLCFLAHLLLVPLVYMSYLDWSKARKCMGEPNQ